VGCTGSISGLINSSTQPDGGSSSSTTGSGGTTGPTGAGGDTGSSSTANLGIPCAVQQVLQARCQGCHSIDGSKSSGPTFKGLAGSQVQLTNGQTVTADDAYLLESILDPDKMIVKGYQPGVMSAVIKPHTVPQDQAKELVDFIKKQK